MKKVAVITVWSYAAKTFVGQLKKLFGDRVEFEIYSYDLGNVNMIIDADLALISLYSVYVNVKKNLPDSCQVVIAGMTIAVDSYAKIMSIPAEEKVLLINYSSEMAVDTIALLNQLGVNHIEFFPYYPDLANPPKLETAVTPGETKYVPSFVKKIIDIGDRVLDAITIIDIAVKLDLNFLLQEEAFIDHFESLKSTHLGLQALMGRNNVLESELDSLLNAMDDGIIGVDAGGLIHAFNSRAEDILSYKKESVIGKNVNEIIPQIPFEQVIATTESVKAMLIKINENDISTTVVPVTVSQKTTGAIAIINRFTEQEKNQHKLRLQLIGKGHKAKYRFEDICGESPGFIKLKNMAARMAKSDSSVLISGESGTGKELFAQAIHNASRRMEYQFVAVNCAALPESLLESELFGYEEGAFTGARKGGKTGLFELAHMGTLFLDEIGEMALNLQTRLLRVIQEREVMRIGGDRVIKIDIRIIAATNKDLKKLVGQGLFRSDLYYRLNVLPLQTIPLRNRKDDILPLTTLFKKELNAAFELTPAAMSVFRGCDWKGNIRELRNCIEYLAHLDEKVIDVYDIPFFQSELDEAPKTGETDSEIQEKLMEEIKLQKEKYIFVLECLAESYRSRGRTSRRKITESASEKGVYLTENEVRGMLKVLNKHEMVCFSKGRGGTQITEQGLRTIDKIKCGLIR